MNRKLKIVSIPLNFDDFSLWLAVTAIILLITSELLSPYYSRTNIRINKRKLRLVAIATAGFFLVTVTIRIIALLM